MIQHILQKINPHLEKLVGLTFLLSVGIALISQHFYGFKPCALCIVERVVLFSIGAFLFFSKNKYVKTISQLLCILLALVCIYHLNIQYSNSATCSVALNSFLLQFVMNHESFAWLFEPTGQCTDKALVLGIPMSGWVLLMAMVSGLIISIRKPHN